METIKIYHAFNGFLYAPVFLADKLGFFPKNTELIYTGGDDKTIAALCEHSSSEDRNWFAICDPFSVNLDEALEHTDDEIRVIGSLINVIPLWAYNTTPDIKPVRKESELGKYKSKITSVVCYPKGTTGFLIGRRISGLLGLSEQFLVPRPFGEEFENHVGESTLVVTADVLRMVYHGLNKGNVVFSYPTKGPTELSPFLFTAILTLKSTVDSNLWTVLGVLGAIRSAVECLSEKHVQERYIDALVETFDSTKYGNVFSKLSLNNKTDKRDLVRQAISYLFLTEKIYSQYPKPVRDEWTAGWENARNAWRALTNKDYPSVEEKQEPIPTLLVKRGWKAGLAEYFRAVIYSPSSVGPDSGRQEFLKWRDKALVIFGWVSLLVSAVLVFRAMVYTFFAKAPDTGQTLGKWMFWLDSGLLVIEGISFAALRKKIYRLMDYHIELIVWLAVLGLLAAFIFRVLEI